MSVSSISRNYANLYSILISKTSDSGGMATTDSGRTSSGNENHNLIALRAEKLENGV